MSLEDDFALDAKSIASVSHPSPSLLVWSNTVASRQTIATNSLLNTNFYPEYAAKTYIDRWNENFYCILGPCNPAFVDAELSDQDIANGLYLEYNPNGILWRVNAAGVPHFDDFDHFLEQNRVIESTTNRTIEEVQDSNNSAVGIGGGSEAETEYAKQVILSKESVNSSYQDPNSPPTIILKDTFEQRQTSTEYFSYIDKDGNTVTKRWTISNNEFLDCNALTQEQITRILMSKNPELVNRGFDTAIYEYAQKLRINPKVLLSSLAQEQNWCRGGGYYEAFGVGAGGNPESFEDGGIAIAARTYLNAFNEGRSYGSSIPAIKVNQDIKADERKAVFGSATAAWEAVNSQYVQYMNEGITIKPVNAAMYAKLSYTPWIDFPPQESQPLMDWHDIFRSF
ncbi:MAG: hypothetical protein H6Q66_286 [Firmicutes bacterium]|nr:hypothetical protein [Bacillota bacterium]